MKKLLSIIIVLFIIVGVLIGVHYYSLSFLNDSKLLIYDNCDVRNTSDNAMEKVLDENSIVVMGSSELAESGNVAKAYPKYLFNDGNSDFNMVLYGRGFMQSLSHAIDVAALQNNIKNNKVVLILSPQWFTKEHYDSTIFSSRFYESSYIELLKNNNVTFETKKEISDRIHSLLVEDQNELNNVIKLEDIYLYKEDNVFEKFVMGTYESFMQEKGLFSVAKEIRNVSSTATETKVIFEDIDFDALMQEEVSTAVEATSNNEYGIVNDYFDTYIRDDYEELKDSMVDTTYTDSQEYDDLRLFLDVCKETNIEPLIISVPVNGYWYDYTGFSKEDRQKYYQNIRDICDEYQVEIADFSDMEYEKYFLRDIMHLGWKGWIYVDQAVYNFYKD